MRRWVAYLPYVLLNVAISALTTLGVLFWWQQSHPAGLLAAGQPAATLVLASGGTGEAGAIPDVPIRIENVFGVGDPAQEVVVVGYTGENPLQLSGWELRRAKQQVYRFPPVLLLANASLQVYTRQGTDGPLTLYVGSGSPLWEQGERVELYDDAGALRAQFQIP